MERIPKSGSYIANRFAFITLKAYEEVVGKNGLNVILNLAGVNNLENDYPPDNLEREFDFTDFTAIHVMLEVLYGPRGGRGLALRAGRNIFEDAFKSFDELTELGDSMDASLPLQERMRLALPAAAKTFSYLSDQQSVTVEETDSAFIWTIRRCPVCWTRKGVDKPVCYIFVGMLQAMFTWASAGREFRVNETQCCAVGDNACEFVIQKEPVL